MSGPTTAPLKALLAAFLSFLFPSLFKLACGGFNLRQFCVLHQLDQVRAWDCRRCSTWLRQLSSKSACPAKVALVPSRGYYQSWKVLNHLMLI